MGKILCTILQGGKALSLKLAVHVASGNRCRRICEIISSEGLATSLKVAREQTQNQAMETSKHMHI
jgi:hypothetical protein